MNQNIIKALEEARQKKGWSVTDTARKLCTPEALSRFANRVHTFFRTGEGDKELVLGLAGVLEIPIKTLEELSEKDYAEDLEAWEYWTGEPIRLYHVMAHGSSSKNGQNTNALRAGILPIHFLPGEIREKIQNYEYGFITALRHAKDDGNKTLYTKEENGKRNLSLHWKLRAYGYLVISIQGSYKENQGTVNELEIPGTIFLAVDINSNQSILGNLLKLGREFEQDSIYFGIANHNGRLIKPSLYQPKVSIENPAINREKPPVTLNYPKRLLERTCSENNSETLGKILDRVDDLPFCFHIPLEFTQHRVAYYPTERREPVWFSKKHWTEL